MGEKNESSESKSQRESTNILSSALQLIAVISSVRSHHTVRSQSYCIMSSALEVQKVLSSSRHCLSLLA